MNTMKNTLHNRIRNAATRLKASGKRAVTRPIAGALSLCLVAGIAATIAMYSQETGDKPAAAGTAVALPVERTLTDAKGRSMAGTVIGKSDTAITFERATDQKKFEIKLDTLSETDRTFIAGIANSAPAASPAANTKTSVLMVTNPRYEFLNINKYSTYAETVQWLSNAGMDVTIGILHDPEVPLERIIEGFAPPPGRRSLQSIR